MKVVNLAYILRIKKEGFCSRSESEKGKHTEGERLLYAYTVHVLLSIKHIYCKIGYYCHI